MSDQGRFGEADSRWTHALDGLPVIAFARKAMDPAHRQFCLNPYKTPERAEITGIDGQYVYVVLDGEDEPRRVHWCDLRPCAPSTPREVITGEAPK